MFDMIERMASRIDEQRADMSMMREQFDRASDMPAGLARDSHFSQMLPKGALPLMNGDNVDDFLDRLAYVQARRMNDQRVDQPVERLPGVGGNLMQKMRSRSSSVHCTILTIHSSIIQHSFQQQKSTNTQRPHKTQRINVQLPEQPRILERTCSR